MWGVSGDDSIAGVVFVAIAAFACVPFIVPAATGGLWRSASRGTLSNRER